MKLVSIKSHGFKSFADKIEINITDGITGIVGPNGSGKSNIVDAVKTGLENLTTALYEKALKHREERTWCADTLDEIVKIASENNGYIKAMWCGDLECELKLKEVADVTSRCMPFGEEPIGDKCVCCGREAKKLVYWGKAY